MAEFEQHMKECAECREYWDLSQQINQKIREELNNIQVPPDLLPRIKKQIQAKARVKRGVAYATYTASTALIIVFSYIGYIQYGIANNLQSIAGNHIQKYEECPISGSPQPYIPRTGMGNQEQPLSIPRVKTTLVESKYQILDKEAEYNICSSPFGKILFVASPNLEGLKGWDGNLRVINEKEYTIAIWRDKTQGKINSLVLKCPPGEVRNILRDFVPQECRDF